jgi:hypothetical protein
MLQHRVVVLLVPDIGEPVAVVIGVLRLAGVGIGDLSEAVGGVVGVGRNLPSVEIYSKRIFFECFFRYSSNTCLALL